MGVHINGNTSSCTSYGGILNGNGHSIKGLMMKNDENGVYQDSALFCKLERATIKQLTIQDSCKFEGRIAGSICVSVSYGVTFENVINQARVSGTEYSGGFIGIVKDEGRCTISISDCVNQGEVGDHNEEIINSLASGGFISAIMNSLSVMAVVSDSKNEGSINGHSSGGFIGMMVGCQLVGMGGDRNVNQGIVGTIESSAGGLIGFVNNNTAAVIELTECKNEQLVAGFGSVGGLIGMISENGLSKVEMLHCVNQEQVVCVMDKGHYGGGLIGGFIDNSNAMLSIENCFNNARVYGQFKNGEEILDHLVYYGGLIGYASINSGRVVVVNSGNNEFVGTENSFSVACGLMCINNKGKTGTEEYEVINSFNNGTVKGSYSYGISTQLTRAHNVVNIGSVRNTDVIKVCHPLWLSVIHASNSFVLDQSNTCGNGYDKSYDDGIVIWKSKSGWYWTYSEEEKTVDDLLNQDILKQQAYDKMWTQSLGLTDPIKVHFGPPLMKSYITYNGSTLDQVLDVAHVSTSEYNVGWRINDTYVYIPPWALTLTEDTDIRLSHNVVTFGDLFLDIEVEHGTHFGQIPEIAPYMNELYKNFDFTYTDINYTANDIVVDDIVMFVIADCVPRNKSFCNGTCKWIAGKCTHSIALGVVIGVMTVFLVILIGVGITLAIYCVAKKKNKNLKDYHGVKTVLLVDQPQSKTSEESKDDQNQPPEL